MGSRSCRKLSKVVKFYFGHTSAISSKNKNDYGRISSGHIIPFGGSQDIISFHFISLFHCDLSNPSVCKFIVNRHILLYQDYCG